MFLTNFKNDTVVADFIDVMKTKFDFNFDLSSFLTAWIHKNMEIKRSFSLFNCL